MKYLCFSVDTVWYLQLDAVAFITTQTKISICIFDRMEAPPPHTGNTEKGP